MKLGNMTQLQLDTMNILNRLLQFVLPKPAVKMDAEKKSVLESKPNFLDEPIGAKKELPEVNTRNIQPENKSFITSLVESTNIADTEKAKDEFISLTAHALRTPLSAIKGLISMIYQGDYGPMNQNLEKPLSNISISTERLIKLVNDLLNISKIQTGKLEFILSTFSLYDSVEKVIKQLIPLAKKNNIEFKILEKKVANVQGDIEKTQDTLNNLFSNALKFTNKGSVEITFKEEGDLIVAFIKDTGIGIAEKDKTKLFQRFQQITNPTSQQISGTGLGLYLSKMVASKMGGDVWLVQSELNKGSTFAFSLPKSGSTRAEEVKRSIMKNQSSHLT